jgi:hypothetical protein
MRQIQHTFTAYTRHNDDYVFSQKKPTDILQAFFTKLRLSVCFLAPWAKQNRYWIIGTVEDSIELIWK